MQPVDATEMQGVAGGLDWSTLGARILQVATLASAIHQAERAELARVSGGLDVAAGVRVTPRQMVSGQTSAA